MQRRVHVDFDDGGTNRGRNLRRHRHHLLLQVHQLQRPPAVDQPVSPAVARHYVWLPSMGVASRFRVEQVSLGLPSFALSGVVVRHKVLPLPALQLEVALSIDGYHSFVDLFHSRGGDTQQ